MILKGREYTMDCTDLKIKIIKVYNVGEEFLKFKGALINKNDNYVYEIKNYKIPLEIVKHWRAI